MIQIISEKTIPRLTFADVSCGETILRDGTYFIKIPAVKLCADEICNAVALTGCNSGMLFSIPLDEVVKIADLKMEAYV